jgi:dipeptidyl-peptidase-4
VKPHGDALAGYDERRRRLWFIAAPDPTGNRIEAVSRGGAPELARLAGTGSPDEASLSQNGETLLVRWTTFGGPGPVVAYRADGTRLAELPSVAEAPPFAPVAEIRKVGPGEGLWTLLVRPRAFEKGHKLPVIVDVYGGPGFQTVQVGPRLLAQWIADQGYLVVAVDGRGTPGRGREWARSIFGDVAGPALDDQVAGLRSLAAEVPEMDLSRVGIWGASFGGYMAALAVMRRPDVFKAAVALAPVTEWRDYDTAYTERYLGLPQEAPRAYERSSLLTYAAGLERPLLLVHGTADDNVYFLHSLKLADALLRAGRRYELLPVPGQTHQLLSADPVLVERVLERIVRYFREWL